MATPIKCGTSNLKPLELASALGFWFSIFFYTRNLEIFLKRKRKTSGFYFRRKTFTQKNSNFFGQKTSPI